MLKKLFNKVSKIEPPKKPIKPSISNKITCDNLSEDLIDKFIQMEIRKRISLKEGIESNHLTNLDPLFEDSARLVVTNQQGSTSLIQRKFSIGYNRAGKIMDQLESYGIIGPFEGSKSRKMLIKDDLTLETLLGTETVVGFPKISQVYK